MKKLLPFVALALLEVSQLPAAQAQQIVADRLQAGQLLGSGGVLSSLRSAGPAPTWTPVAASRAIGSWVTRASLSQIRGQHAAAALNGKLYVWGGYVDGVGENNSLEIYNPTTNTWSAGAALPEALRGHAHAVGANSLLYSFSGVNNGVRVNSSYSYNPTTNVWTTIASIPVGVWESRAVTGADGRIYVLGGENNLNGNQIYNPTTNTWTTGASIPASGGLIGTAAVVDGSGLIHAIGGASSSYSGVSSHYVYNPTTNTWTTAAALPGAIAQAGATLGADGKIYVVGGKNYAGNNSAPFFQSVYVYTPSTNTWATDTSLPISLGETKAVTLGADIYTLAGCNGSFQSVVYRTSTTGLATWTGATSTAWALGSNWSGGVVPSATDDVTIPAGLTNYPVVSTAAPTARTVTVSTGASLAVANGGTLTLTGNLVNNGTFTAVDNASVALSGSATQSVGGSATTQFRNLTVGASGATLSGRVEIQRLLTLNGNLATSGQQFLILSNNLGSAMVYNNGGAVTGNTIVQRYIDAAGNAGFGYRHFAPAVSGATLSNLAIFPILPGAQSPGPLQINSAYNSDAQPGTVTPFPTVYSYDQSRVGTVAGPVDFGQGYQSPTAANQPVTATRGLSINEPAGNFFELTGTSLNNGFFSSGTLSRSTQADGGWHLLGNPYPAPIDWTLVARTNVDDAVYLYRSTGQYDGGYVSFVNNVGDGRYIPMGQAFFTRVSTVGASGSVVFNNTARLTTYTDPTYSRPAAVETRPLLQLQLQRVGQSGVAGQDAFYLYEQAGATAGFDAGYDALKVQLNGGTQPSIYHAVGSENLAIQGLPADNAARNLALGVNAPVAGQYEFRPEQLLNFAAGEAVWLEDKLTGTWHDLRQGAYTAQLSQGLSATRFVLHLHQGRVTAAKTAWIGEVQLYPNPAAKAPVTVVASGLTGSTVQLVLVNGVGQRVWQQTAALTGRELRTQVPVAALASGMYTLQVQSAAGVLTRKLVVQ